MTGADEHDAEAWVDVPASAADEYVTVLNVELEGPLNLYGGEGVEIDAN